MRGVTVFNKPICPACKDPDGRVNIECYHNNNVDATCAVCGHKIAVCAPRADLLDEWRRQNSNRPPVSCGTSVISPTKGTDR